MQMLLSQADIDRDPAYWLERRRAAADGQPVLGASELSQVMGLAPAAWGGAYSLYWAKAEGTSKPDSDDMRRGRHLEAYISERFAAENPTVQLHPGGLYAADTVPWLRATFDRLGTDTTSTAVPGEPGCVFPVQYKSAVPQRDAAGQPEWGDPGTDQVPLHIAVQVQCEMIVSDASYALVPMLHMLKWQVSVYRVEADKDDQAAIMAAGAEFVDRLVRHRPPPVDWTPEATRTLWARNPGVDDAAVRVPWGLARRYHRAGIAAGKADRRRKLAANQLLDRAGTAARLVAVNPATGDEVLVATRQVSPRRAYSVAAHPGVQKLDPSRIFGKQLG
jgi:YqaJ-like viral recombinase domain